MVSNLFICLIPAVLVLIGIRKLRQRSWGFCQNNVTLDDKVAIVTGANCGIGFQVAKELASRNAEVVLACRNIGSARQAIVRIKDELKKNLKMVVALELDLASLKSVERFASEVQQMYPQIHLLVNNAGVAYPKNELHFTSDGFEMHLGVNHLGHFHLTNLLLETLKKSVPSRIVVVTSSLHEKGSIDFDSLTRPRVGANLYANSKLANVYFSKELSKRLQGTGVNLYAVCPGWVYTSLFRHAIKWYHYVLVAPVAFLFMRSPRQGAQTIIYCATEPCLREKSGCLYRNCAEYSSKVDFDDAVSVRLWEESERLVEEMLK